MLHNYLKSSIRNLFKNKTISIINILGLSLGISAILIVTLYVRYEYSFDNFHPNADRIYRVVDHMKNKDNMQSTGYCSASAGEFIKSELAGIENMVRVSRQRFGYFNVDNKLNSSNKVLFVDSSFFEVFGFRLLQGDLGNILRSPNEVLLTEEYAIKLYGTTNVVGRNIEYESNEYQISGIVCNPPENSVFQFEAIFPYSALKNFDVYLGWDGGMRFGTYLLLEDESLRDDVEASFIDFLETHRNSTIRSYGWEETFTLQHIEDIHLKSDTRWDYPSNKNMSSIKSVFFIGVIILIIAILNYINLGTSQSFRRSKEIGLRKIAGSTRMNLIYQYLWESIIVCLIAIIPTLIIFELINPMINKLLRTNLSLYSGDNISMIPLILAIPIVTGIISGIYPSFTLSGLPPITIFQIRKKIYTTRSHIRNLFVIIQFMISSILIIISILFYRQVNFMENKRLGFDKDQLAYLSFSIKADSEKQLIFKEELQSIPEIKNSTLISEIPGYDLTKNGFLIPGHDDVKVYNTLYTDKDFIDCCNIQIVKGRNFNDHIHSKSPKILVNEKLISENDLKEPIGQLINRNNIDYEIIGVVKDFHFAPLYREVAPLIISTLPEVDGWEYNAFLIRLSPNDFEKIKLKAERIWKEHFPDIPFIFGFVNDYIKGAYQVNIDFNKFIFIFTIIALTIACFGLLGLSIFILDQKTREVGIRKVLGASLSRIFRLLISDIFKLMIIANVLTWPIAWYLCSKWLQRFAYKVDISIWIFAIAFIVSVAISILVISGKTLKTALINPVDVLKDE